MNITGQVIFMYYTLMCYCYFPYNPTSYKENNNS